MQPDLNKKKKRVHHVRHVVAPARRTAAPVLPAGPAATSDHVSPSAALDYEKNPAWRLTAEGQKEQTRPPWLLVTLAFGLPFLALVVLSFLL